MKRGDVSPSRKRLRRLLRARRRPRAGRSLALALLAVIAVAATISAVDHGIDRFQRDRAVEAHVEAGHRALGDGDYELAEAAYARALEVNPTAPRLLRLRSRARAYQIAERPETARPEQLGELRYDVQALLASDADHAAAYLTARAVVLARLGDEQGSRAALDAALERDPGFPPARLAIAERLAAAGQPEEARKHYEAALKSRPHHAGSLLGLAMLDLAAGHVDEGIERLRAALAVRDDFNARLTLVDALVSKGALNEALAEAQKAAAASPQAAEPHRRLGRIYSMLDRLPDAERELRAALSAHATTQTFLDLATVLGQQGRSKEALQTFKRVLRDEPHHPVALFGAGMAAEDAGLPEEAMELLQKLVALLPAKEGKELASLQAMAQKRLEKLRSALPAASASRAVGPDAKGSQAAPSPLQGATGRPAP